jgi:hypothetical protein
VISLGNVMPAALSSILDQKRHRSGVGCVEKWSNRIALLCIFPQRRLGNAPVRMIEDKRPTSEIIGGFNVAF